MLVQLYTVELAGSGRLSIMPRPRGGDWLADEVAALQEAGVEVLVSLLTNWEIRELDLGAEAELCQERSIRYLSFPIQDFSVPASESEARAFLEGLKVLLLEGKHVAMHCRGGIGRSGLMAGCLLVLSGYPPQQALELVSAARGLDIPETDEQRAWVAAFARQTQAREAER